MFISLKNGQIGQIELFKKKKLPKREFHDGDTVEFYFKPNSNTNLDHQEVILVGTIYGVKYENNSINYKVQLKDNKRKISGEFVVPEDMIKGRIGQE